MFKQVILLFTSIAASTSEKTTTAEIMALRENLTEQAIEKSEAIADEIGESIETTSYEDKVVKFNKKPEIPPVPIWKLSENKDRLAIILLVPILKVMVRYEKYGIHNKIRN